MLLVTNDTSVRRSVSNLIAVISAIEIPRKEWQTIIPQLTASTGN